jgi:DNA-binding transcriptional ArsR family regulator
MPFYHEPSTSGPPSPSVVVGGSVASELDWVLHAAFRPDFRRDHATLGEIYTTSPQLLERARTFWGRQGLEGSGCMEVTILAHHGGLLFCLDADELLGRLEGLCATAPAELRLTSETPDDGVAMRARLARLRSSPETRAAYVELVRDVWAAVRPDWLRNGVRSVEATVAARREIQHRGAPWQEIARNAYRPESRICDDMVASLPPDGTVAVVPAYFAHVGSLVDLPGTVIIGVRAEGSAAEARARTEVLARRLKTISDPTRLAIVEVLRSAPSTVSELAELFSLAQPTVSNHVKILRDAGIVTNSSTGGHRELVLQRDALEELLGHLVGVLSPERLREAPHAATGV